MSRPIFVHCLGSIPTDLSGNDPVINRAHLKALGEMLVPLGLELICSNQAFQRLRRGEVVASQLMLLADEVSYNTSAEFLRRKGAIPYLILSGESPCIAKTFYQRLAEITQPYRYKMLFRFFSEDLGGFVFPSYSKFTKPKFLEMAGRRFSVMVSANKYYRAVSGLNLWKPKRMSSWIRGKFNISTNSFTRSLREGLLYEKRLEIIDSFESREELDLFGAGWNNLGNLPYHWRKVLGVKLKPAGKCSDKIDTISNYRFCFAIENYSCPSYVTEKLIEAIYAGCVPVYLGAPDIAETVPADAFLDIRNYTSIKDLKYKMLNMSDAECENIVHRAQDWLLNESKGRAFSYEAFAERFVESCVKPLGRFEESK